MSAFPGRFDPVQVAQAGGAMVGLEGAVATRDGEVLLWGWLQAEQGASPELSCEVAGQTQGVELLARSARPDVLEMLAPSVAGVAPDLGFVGLARVEPDLLERAGGRISLLLGMDGERASSVNRLRLEPQADLAQLAEALLPLKQMRPSDLHRAARVVGEARSVRTLGDVFGAVEHEDTGPRREAELSVVIPVRRNLRALRETLSYLDMGPDSGRLEVVLALTAPELWPTVVAEVAEAASALPARVVRPARPVSIGAAARIGLEFARADHVLLMSDAVAPPSGDWVASLLEDLASVNFGAPEAMPRFDGPPHRFEPRRPRVAGLAWSHDGLRPELLERMALLGLDIRSPAVFAARRSALLEAGVAWAGLTTEGAFWVDLLNEGVRRGLVSLRTGGAFTYAPLDTEETEPTGPAELWDLYGLAARWARWADLIAASAEREAA